MFKHFSTAKRVSFSGKKFVAGETKLVQDQSRLSGGPEQDIQVRPEVIEPDARQGLRRGLGTDPKGVHGHRIGRKSGQGQDRDVVAGVTLASG